MSKTVEKYQQEFNAIFPSHCAFSFWKGRVGLYSILQALGIGPGDEVIVPAYTCVANALPIKYLGATPVYVDIEPNTFNIDINHLESKITSRTRVIIAQHTYGYLADMDAILEIAGRGEIKVIEDCCLALGSQYKGKLAGTFGMAAYFSSQWNKPYTTGLGGMVICHEAELARKIEQICQDELQPVPLKRILMLAAQLTAFRAFVYPRTTAFAQNVFHWLDRRGLVAGSASSQASGKPVMPPDFFMGMSALQAQQGLKQLDKLYRNIEHRRQIARLYDELFAELGWQVTPVPEYTKPVLVRYPVRVADKSAVLAAANKHGIEINDWPVSPLSGESENDNPEMYDYRWGMCHETEKIAREVVELPVHPRTSEKTARHTVEFLCNFQQAT